MLTGFWSFYRFESNESLGENKPSFMTDALNWPTQPIETSWHHYVEEHLTCDEEEKMVTHPGSSSKPKQMLSTSSKGQAMLPTNCLTAHGDQSQFLNYQKQVLRAFVEWMYGHCCQVLWSPGRSWTSHDFVDDTCQYRGNYPTADKHIWCISYDHSNLLTSSTAQSNLPYTAWQMCLLTSLMLYRTSLF